MISQQTIDTQPADHRQGHNVPRALTFSALAPQGYGIAAVITAFLHYIFHKTRHTQQLYPSKVSGLNMRGECLHHVAFANLHRPRYLGGITSIAPFKHAFSLCIPYNLFSAKQALSCPNAAYHAFRNSLPPGGTDVCAHTANLISYFCAHHHHTGKAAILTYVATPY